VYGWGVISKWYELKDKAIKLRSKGKSIGSIELKLGIPRSTLSGWFKNIQLTDVQKEKLKAKMLSALVKSRRKAILWHNSQKELHLQEAERQADLVLKGINTKNKNVVELALSLLYLGEGSKNGTTSLGNSNPLILNFFIASIKSVYGIDKNSARCELHLRSDQDEVQVINFWSKELQIPKEKFIYTKDKRTIKSATYPNYMGVCVVRFNKIAIMRRLMFLSQKFCNIISATDP
jgi:hypothetical protein